MKRRKRTKAESLVRHLWSKKNHCSSLVLISVALGFTQLTNQPTSPGNSESVAMIGFSALQGNSTSEPEDRDFSHRDQHMLKCGALTLLSVLLASVAAVNFSLAFFVAVFTVPACLYVAPTQSKYVCICLLPSFHRLIPSTLPSVYLSSLLAPLSAFYFPPFPSIPPSLPPSLSFLPPAVSHLPFSSLFHRLSLFFFHSSYILVGGLCLEECPIPDKLKQSSPWRAHLKLDSFEFCTKSRQIGVAFTLRCVLRNWIWSDKPAWNESNAGSFRDRLCKHGHPALSCVIRVCRQMRQRNLSQFHNHA